MTDLDGQIYVDYGSISQVMDAIQGANAQIKGIMDDINSYAMSLQGKWSGASADEYSQVQARWTSDLDQMNSLLPHYGNTLDDMTTNYNRTDNNLAAQWSSIT
jgi:WXG100 family type VII secretion target